MIKTENGFTLVDILMVIAIMLILSIMAIPRMTSYYTVKLFGVAHKLATDIRYAQQLAISKQITCGLFFDTATESYFLYEKTIATKAKDPYARGDLIVSYKTEDTYKGVDLVSTNFGDRIEFDPLGTPYDSSGSPLALNGQVVLQSIGESRTVDIIPNTGVTRVQ